MEPIHSIVLPTRPQPDTLVAIFLLRTLGNEKFPGVENASSKIDATPQNESFEAALKRGILLIDVGGGPLDHHGSDTCASELVAKALGVEKDPSLKKLLSYAKRDDAEGKGTLSTDPLDRAFGLSGLVSSLNKQHSKNPQRIVDIVMPLLEAHYVAAREHHVELPQEVAEKKTKGQYSEETLRQGKKKLKVVFVVSEKPSMPTYLRSWNGARADVVVQKSEDSSRTCVITKQDTEVDLSSLAALVRMREAELRGIALETSEKELFSTGRIDMLPNWYLDPATNSLLNVGEEKDNTRIEWDEFKQIVRKGLELQFA
ncbi:hypothetical protein KKD81_01690 [Patescibacteria group bacterium]|nr:hypothetical protein [Patescibacteria group bacterium]